MKKILLSACAILLTASISNAGEYQQYVSAKATYGEMKNRLKFSMIDKHDHTEDIDYENGAFKLDDNVWGGSLAYGIKYKQFRAEAELNLRQDAKKTFYDTDGKSKFVSKNNSVMFNVYYDIENKTKFTPYLGGGIGVAKLKTTHAAPYLYDNTVRKIKDSATNFAWQLGCGVSYDITDNIAADLGYRYVNSGHYKLYDYDPREGDIFDSKIKSSSNEISFGIKYTF